MNNLTLQKDDEVSLLAILTILLDGKWKIISIVALVFFSTYFYEILNKSPDIFHAETEIKPLTDSNTAVYESYNDYSSLNVNGVNTITSEYLINLYVEELKRSLIINKAIKKYELVDRTKFNTEIQYNNAIILIEKEVKVEKHENSIGDTFWNIRFKVEDKDKWKSVLSYININVNKQVQKIMKENIDIMINDYNQKFFFRLEDLDIERNNLSGDYLIEINNRLVNLREQASLARHLDIPNNTIDANKYSNNPLYLRGYMALEKEIRILEERKFDEPFIGGLSRIDNQIRDINQNKVPTRIRNLLNKTPLMSENNFIAVELKIDSTKFISNMKTIRNRVLYAVLGLIFSIIYVLSSSAIRTQREQLAIK